MARCPPIRVCLKTAGHTAEHDRSGSKTGDSIGLLSHLLKCYDTDYDALSN